MDFDSFTRTLPPFRPGTKSFRMAGVALLASSALCFPGTARAACSDAATTVEMRACRGQEYEAADAELNAVYGQLKATASDEVMTQVRAAQRAWIPFRDAACLAEAAPYEGGTIQPLIHVSCLTRLTQRRSEDLRAILPK
ncbi:lysozyme inhibitor LprI family protein [Alloyangia pacifica]|uniref:lysozyme inhibitor LprI family protein n=1 Tax=Alloyangia pacifica TaxID=311180 RepID=UPI001CFC4D5B|nr:lysozyme inhibitor LprI family protein [Alloyangia pacifica]